MKAEERASFESNPSTTMRYDYGTGMTRPRSPG